MSKGVKIDLDDIKFRPTVWQLVAASSTGALIASLCVTPLDVVKVRLQAQQKSAKHARNAIKFNGTTDAFVKIVKHEGVGSLWGGFGPSVVLTVPATAVYFVTYDLVRVRFKDLYNKKNAGNKPMEQPYWLPLVAGATARMIASIIVSPIELIKTKMQSAKISYTEVGKGLTLLIKEDGVKGLWKGLMATLYRDVPFSAVYWANYEALKSFFGPEIPTFEFSFMAGAISGGLAATITVPFDVVKTYQQVELGRRKGVTGSNQTVIAILSCIRKENGFKGLFAGLTPRLVRVMPACAIMISCFEYVKLSFNKSELIKTTSATKEFN